MAELREPPVVKDSFFFKRLLQGKKSKLELLRQGYKDHGEIFYVHDGKNKMLVLAGQEANRFVSKEGKDIFSSVEFWQGTVKEMGCPHSFIGVDGDAHQYQRSLMQPMFARAYFKDKIASLLQVSESELLTCGSGEVTVAPLLRRILSKQIGGSLQGEIPQDEEIEAMMAFQTTAINVCSLRIWPKFVLKMPHYRKAKRLSKAFANRIIDRARREKNTERYLDQLMDKGERENPQWFTHGDLENHAMIPYLAGIDTVGATLGFMLYELIRHPEVKARLQEEVDQFFNAETFSLAAMAHMRQLDAFLKEVLRLYPTAFAIRRMVTDDFEFNGYQVKKGQFVIIFTTADHTNPEYFDNPEQFNIDRFLPGNAESLATTGVISPFGKGPHTCLGSGLANTLMPLNLAFFLYTMNIEAGSKFDKVKVHCSPLAHLSPSFSIRVSPRNRVDFSRFGVAK